MRHIYKIYPNEPCDTIDSSMHQSKIKYTQMCGEGIVVGDECYKMNNDDIALLYRQCSANVTSVSHDDCICFAVCFGNVGMISIDECASKTRIVNVTSDNIIDGQIVLEDSTRYIINNPSTEIKIIRPNTLSEYVQSYEIDLTIGDNPNAISLPDNIQWIGNQPVFKTNMRYLIYIDGNIGVSTEL